MPSQGEPALSPPTLGAKPLRGTTFHARAWWFQVHNVSLWARQYAMASKYLCDSVGHEDPTQRAACVRLAEAHAAHAIRAATKPVEKLVMVHFAHQLDLLRPNQIEDCRQ